MILLPSFLAVDITPQSKINQQTKQEILLASFVILYFTHNYHSIHTFVKQEKFWNMPFYLVPRQKI